MNMKLISWLVGFAADEGGFLSIEVPTLTASLIVAIGIITGLIIGFAPTARDALGSHFVAEANAYAEGCDRKCRKQKRREQRHPKQSQGDMCDSISRWDGWEQRMCAGNSELARSWDGLTGKQQKKIRDWLDGGMPLNAMGDFDNPRSSRQWDFDPSTGDRRCRVNVKCWWQ